MWKVIDRWKNEIILTQERWKHIVDHHWELQGRLNDVLKTIRAGKRKQELLNPQKFKYFYPFDDLPYNYTHIVVVVKLAINKFVITAYPIKRSDSHE
ncbi:MAG: hypothetical protein AB1567_11125 [bacterium]